MKITFFISRIAITFFTVVLLCVCITKNAFGQASPSVLYIPLIGITLVPEPLALPDGAGYVTYHYAVKNFIKEVPLNNIHVVDDACSPIKFVSGDDNNNSILDYGETWRYVCTTKISQTTNSSATVTGSANSITATHRAYATVVVGSSNLPPLVSIVNITKVAYPLSLPQQGGKITYTYKVTNPGVVPLSNVVVTDDKCSQMSGRLGDTNNNNLLDTNEVWIYTCTTVLKQTTINTAHVSAFGNNFKAEDYATIAVTVDNSLAQSSPKFPNVGKKPEVQVNPYITGLVWAVFAIIIMALILFFTSTQKNKFKKNKRRPKPLRMK